MIFHWSDSIQFQAWHLSAIYTYRKKPKNLDTWKIAIIILNVENGFSMIWVLHAKDADGMANSVDPDQY